MDFCKIPLLFKYTLCLYTIESSKGHGPPDVMITSLSWVYVTGFFSLTIQLLTKMTHSKKFFVHKSGNTMRCAIVSISVRYALSESHWVTTATKHVAELILQAYMPTPFFILSCNSTMHCYSWKTNPLYPENIPCCSISFSHKRLQRLYSLICVFF